MKIPLLSAPTVIQEPTYRMDYAKLVLVIVYTAPATNVWNVGMDITLLEILARSVHHSVRNVLLISHVRHALLDIQLIMDTVWVVRLVVLDVWRAISPYVPHVTMVFIEMMRISVLLV